MIDPFNTFAVAVTGANEIVILAPPRGPMSPKDALLLAAWLVVLSAPFTEDRFMDALEAIQS